MLGGPSVARSVRLWQDSGPFPPAAYADTNFLLFVWEARRGKNSRNSRVRAADALLERMLSAGVEVWTSVFGIQEACWWIMRRMLDCEKNRLGLGSLNYADFKRCPEFADAIRPATMQARNFCRLFTQTGMQIRDPRYRGVAAVPDDLLYLIFRLFFVKYPIEPADALHLAIAWWDREDGNAAIISDDRAMQQVSEVQVFAYERSPQPR